MANLTKGSDYFGYAATINSDGTIIVAGAYGDDDVSNGAGAIYIYKKGLVGWTLAVKLYASDGAAGNQLGQCCVLSCDGGNVLLGAIFDSPKGTASGALYVFR